MRFERTMEFTDTGSVAMMRWLRGHQTFHMVLLTINTEIGDSVTAIDKADRQGLAKSLRRLRMLYDAATANMNYAADFPADVYEKTIRPSMMPPAVNSGFSGTLNTEHKIMLKGLTGLRQKLVEKFGPDSAGWPDDVAQSWGELEQAKRMNRQNHGLICSKFVEGGVSLLADFYRNK